MFTLGQVRLEATGYTRQARSPRRDYPQTKKKLPYLPLYLFISKITEGD